MEKIQRLYRLAKKCQELGQFFDEIKRWPKSYGMPLWSKIDYEKVYNGVKANVR